MLRVAVPIVIAFHLTAVAHAQSPVTLDLVTVGAPGNRATNALETPSYPDTPRGSVPYEFRMMRTELTVAQHFEFAQAYLQFNPQAIYDSAFRGPSLGWTIDDRLVMFPETANLPTAMSWRMAARMCNWYHNGKVNEAWAFESGAYDTSTFVQLPDGSRLDQLTRSAGARFWIPSVDEWIKAAYYDPNRNGHGVEGYWQQPNGTNQPLISDYPQNGGQTNAGSGVDIYTVMAVGQYPGTQSPWGLLDVSGGRIEWLEDPVDVLYSRDRQHAGSFQGQSLYMFRDPIDLVLRGGARAEDQALGIRLAAAIPAPGSVLVLSCCTLPLAARRRRST